jgi:rhomboid protease GluP
MSIRRTIKENWITRKMPEGGLNSTLFTVLLLAFGSFLFLTNIFNARSWMPATGERVLIHHEYWRLWSALFAHGDLAHILGNLFLFIPFAFFLSSYFTLWLFPLVGFLLGGMINYLVIKTLPLETSLIGVSGVVYWMGALWMTLAFFIDRRETLLQRWLKVSGVSLVLFFPTTFLPEISYLSHFLGYILGVFTGIVVYILFKNRFKKAEIIQDINDDEAVFDWENFRVEDIHFKPLEESDFPLLNNWLSRDHVKNSCLGKFAITQGQESPSDHSYIVTIKQTPIGLIHCFKGKSLGSVSINQFIADKNLLGKGLGTSFIKKFCDELFNDNNVVAIESNPSASNGAAIRAYKKAGFVRQASLMTNEGAVVPMIKMRQA